MNLGLLVGPFLAGTIYDRAGYYAVFGTILGIIAFDFILRLAMVEKQSNNEWGTPDLDSQNEDRATGTDIMESQKHGAGPTGSKTREVGEGDHEATPLLRQNSKGPQSWLHANFPTATTLLGSPRLMAAIGGAFTQTLLVTAFDPILPLFVNRTFGWGPTGSGTYIWSRIVLYHMAVLITIQVG